MKDKITSLFVKHGLACETERLDGKLDNAALEIIKAVKWDVEFSLRDALQKYSEWLEAQGYLDTDWRQEEPLSIDEYIKNQKSKERYVEHQRFSRKKPVRPSRQERFNWLKENWVEASVLFTKGSEKHWTEPEAKAFTAKARSRFGYSEKFIQQDLFNNLKRLFQEGV